MSRAQAALDAIAREIAAQGFRAHGVHVLIGDEEAARRWAPDRREEIHSIAKAVAVLAAAIASDEGLFDLDAPVPRYFPRHPARGGRGHGDAARPPDDVERHRSALVADPVRGLARPGPGVPGTAAPRARVPVRQRQHLHGDARARRGRRRRGGVGPRAHLRAARRPRRRLAPVPARRGARRRGHRPAHRRARAPRADDPRRRPAPEPRAQRPLTRPARRRARGRRAPRRAARPPTPAGRHAWPVRSPTASCRGSGTRARARRRG